MGRVLKASILAMLVAACPFCLAQDPSLTVKEIRITGNKTISEELIRSLIETEVGEEISIDKLSKDIKEIYNSTGAFYDIQVDVRPTGEGLIVEYKLFESPKIKEIRIEGNSAIKEKEIRDRINISPGEFYHEKTVWDNERRIEELYKEKGYYNAKVKAVREENGDGTIDLVFRIDEGRKVKVGKVEFVGNDSLSDRAIRKVMKTRKGKFLRESVLEEDVKRIEELYRDKGFAFAKVEKVEKLFSEDGGSVTVRIKIREGKQFRIRRYDIEVNPRGERIFSEDELRSRLSLDVGDIFNREKLQEDIASLQQAYADKGYITTEIIPDVRFNEEKGYVDIKLTVNEGGLVLINKVEITGLERTKEEVIRRELERLDIKPGKPFNVQNIRKARQRIFSLGPFIRGVDFIPGPAQGDKRDLIVQIIESPQAGSFGIGGGYSSQDGLFGFAEISHNNLFGRAYRVHFKGEIGLRRRKIAQFIFSTPWILNSPTSLTLSLYNTQRERYLFYFGSRTRTYTDKRYGGSITLGRSITRNVDLSVRFKDEMISAEIPEEFSEIYRGYERRETRSLTFYLTRDTRDFLTSMFDPSGGSMNEFSVEFSGLLGGGERMNRFQRFTYEGAWFYNPFWKFVLAAHLKIGYLRAGPLETQEDKMRQLGLIYERYFLGGADTVRGYDDFSIVPKGDEVISSMWGGNKMFYLNLEWRFPIVETVRGVLFFDMGQTWNERTGTLRDLIRDFRPRKSVGVGLRFEMFGMLARLEYGYALDRDLGAGRLAPRGKFHFTIGPAF